jgi:GNAT superfamily N-acetyltransferase
MTLPSVFDEWPHPSRSDFLVSTDRSLLNLDVIHGFLSNCYWSAGIPREVVVRAIEHSLCFGMYDSGRQIGFARAISDLATFAYIADVFILESYRGQGLSKWLMECIRRHPQLQGLRRWALATRDAHGLYAQFGFTPLQNQELWMEIFAPEIYSKHNL